MHLLKKLFGSIRIFSNLVASSDLISSRL